MKRTMLAGLVWMLGVTAQAANTIQVDATGAKPLDPIFPRVSGTTFTDGGRTVVGMDVITHAGAPTATTLVEAYGGIGVFSTTPTGNTGWLDFTAWNKVSWSCPPNTNWATIFIEGANSATRPAYSEAGSPLSGAGGVVVGSTPNGVIDPCPRFLRWYLAGTGVASNVSGYLRWRATR